MITLNVLHGKEDYHALLAPYLDKAMASRLIQVFTHRCDRGYINALLAELKAFMPDAVIIGATTDGEILGSRVTTGETVISFTFLETTQLRLYSASYKESGSDSHQKGQDVARSFVDSDVRAAIAFADGLHTNADDFLQGFASVAPDIVIGGGLAGDNATFTGTYVFTQEGIVEEGTVAVAFEGEALQVVTDYGFGWIPIGKELRVTKADKNHVYTIDHVPASEVYSSHLGSEAGDKLPAIGIEFPLIVRENGHDMARAVLAKEDDGSLIFAGNLPEGSSVCFGVGQVGAILSDSQKLLTSMQQYPVESIFSYSCMARRRFLGDDASLEFEALSHIAPIAGFCTYGEFYHHGDTNYLFNQTTTLMAMWEEGSRYKNEHHTETANAPKAYRLDTLKALTHLINVVTNELSEANSELEERSRIMLMQSRLSAMGEMIGNIAHQWRQPLNSLALTIQDVEDAYHFGEVDQAYIQEMTEKSMSQIRYMSKTIDDFRNFLRPNSRADRFTFDGVLANAHNLLSGTLSNHSISLDVNNRCESELSGNLNEIVQIVVNLVNNAKDALISHQVAEKRIWIDTTEKGGYAEMRVADNAGGIPETLMEKIFEPYFTTKDEMHGSGLGLYMSKMIIEQRLGGRIDVQNRDEGACFILRFPVATESCSVAGGR